MGAGRGATRKPDPGHPVRCGRGSVRHGPLLCRRPDHSRSVIRKPRILVLPDLVCGGSGRVSPAGQPVFPGTVHLPQGHLLHSEIHPGEDFGETPQNASGYHSGHIQWADETGHCGSGGEYGAASGPPAAGDDCQRVWSGMHSRLSVRAGLAYGPAEPGIYPCRHGFHDDSDGKLQQAV